MLDCDIRNQLRRTTLAAHQQDPHTLIVDEFDVHRKARIDLAVVNGELAGFEIKSPSDDLRRLSQQSEFYGHVFDRLTLVVAECHFVAGIEHVPHWWGITVVSDYGRAILEEYRQPDQNPSVNAEALAKLLWREEALALLETHGLAWGIKSKPRKYAWQRVASEIPLSILKPAVRNAIRARSDWRAASA